MKSDKGLDILKRIILTIILFAVYILIINLSNRIFLTEEWSREIEKTIYLFRFYVSIIFTVIYNLIAKRFLNLNYEKAEDYIWSFVSFDIFSLANIIFCYIVPMSEDGWFGSTFVRIWLCIQLFAMYILGNGLYILICFVIRSIRNKTYGEILKRVLSAVIGYPLYMLAALIPFSCIEWIQIEHATEIVIYLFFALVAGVVTGIFHFISGRIIKVSYEKVQDHVIILCFFGIAAILCSALNSTIGVVKENFVSGKILMVSVKAIFIYIFGNMVYFVWCNERKRRKRSVDGGSEEGNSMDIDKDLTKEDRAEGKDITEGDGMHNGFASYKQYDFSKAVLENIKLFLSGFEDEFFPVDDEYHLQAGKNVCHPDLLFYNMKLQCLVAVDLKIDDLKPEYSDRMYNYLDALDRDVKKPHENPSVGIILCKNEDTEVVEYCLNKSLSQEMANEYETKLIDKKILKEKLGELYDMMKEPKHGVNT